MVKLLIVAATEREVAPIRAFLDKEFKKEVPFSFFASIWDPIGFALAAEFSWDDYSGCDPWEKARPLSTYYRKDYRIDLLITGVGMVFTTLRLANVLHECRADEDEKDYDLVLNVGIAGAFPHSGLKLGQVVEVVQEDFADFGIETARGGFISVNDMELFNSDWIIGDEEYLENPFSRKWPELPGVFGITVNKVHGTEKSIKRTLAHYRYAERKPDIETMEGAAFFTTCLELSQPFAALRAISNMVERRNKAAWDIPGAIDALGKEVVSKIEDKHFCLRRHS